MTAEISKKIEAQTKKLKADLHSFAINQLIPVLKDIRN